MHNNVSLILLMQELHPLACQSSIGLRPSCCHLQNLGQVCTEHSLILTADLEINVIKDRQNKKSLESAQRRHL